ncbi:hypothetical protein WN48_00042 [Eufriesea mexicana]|nr:hypothetical protein WN48_00042 [Eufriesea mexicana]
MPLLQTFPRFLPMIDRGSLDQLVDQAHSRPCIYASDRDIVAKHPPVLWCSMDLVTLNGESRSPKEDCEMEAEEELGVVRNECRKLWKTLDAPLDLDCNDNLYVAVRQSLHKVNRVSQTSLASLKSSPEAGNRGGVSQESSMGRFSTIKAFFDQDMGQEKGTRSRCRTTKMAKLMRMLGLRKRDLFADGLAPMGCLT